MFNGFSKGDGKDRTPDCHCYTCDKEIHHLGVMSHRAMHRRKAEDCRIMFSTGEVRSYNFSRRAIDNEKR